MSSHSDCGFVLLTEACNLKCAHCYVSAEPSSGRHMSLFVLDRTFTVLQSLGISDIRLTGGEPTIHPDFHGVIALAARQDIRLGLVSNGIRLLRNKRALEILGSFSRCWISVYGLESSSHRRIGGHAVVSLDEILEKVGRLSRMGNWIGVSALVNVGEGVRVLNLMTAAANYGVTKLRFLPVQPDGRMLLQEPQPWIDWPEEVKRIVCMIKEHPRAADFDVLTINDPFDLTERFDDPLHSCLLRHRQMWSVVPTGDIYPCCFTVYKPTLRLGNVADNGIEERLRQFRIRNPDGIRCHGLSSSFWLNARPKRVTCSISAIDPRTD